MNLRPENKTHWACCQQHQKILSVRIIDFSIYFIHEETEPYSIYMASQTAESKQQCALNRNQFRNFVIYSGLVICYVKLLFAFPKYSLHFLTFSPLYLECSPSPSPPSEILPVSFLRLIPKATSSTVQPSSIIPVRRNIF